MCLILTMCLGAMRLPRSKRSSWKTTPRTQCTQFSMPQGEPAFAAHLRILTKSSAPARVALSTGSMTSRKGYNTLRAAL